MYTVVIPRENNHTRLFTAYRASQIYFKYLNIDQECEFIDLNCEEHFFPKNKKLIFPIEWNATFINPNFQTFINHLSDYNEIILTGRYVDYYSNYSNEKFTHTILKPESEMIDWDTMLYDPIFLLNKNQYAYAPIESSLGCSGRCHFCSNRILSECNPFLKKWKPYETLGVVDYISRVHNKYDAYNFCFNDNNFINSPEHALQISSEILKRGIKIKYAIETRVDNICDDIIKELKKSGLRKVMLGLESGSDKFLTRFNKGTTVEQNKKAIDILRKNNINIDPQIILFYPMASYSEIGETLEFIDTEKLYNFSASGGSFITKMMIFESDNPEDMYLYEYKDAEVSLFEKELKNRNISFIRNEQDFDIVKRIYNMFC